MADKKFATFKKVNYSPAKKDNNGRVMGNPYQFKSSNGKDYMLVPEKMVTLPKGNHFIVMRKHSNNKKGDIITYVYGYVNLESKRQASARNSKRVRRYYFVARQISTFGNPKLALFRYCGYDQNIARQVFRDIPYNDAQYIDKDGIWHEFSGKGKTAADIVTANIRRQEGIERMKTLAYGSKEDRRYWRKQQYGR